jgi:hypothetical protein
MMKMPPSPLHEAVAELRLSILQTWVHHAMAAYEQAAVLLGIEGERRRLNKVHVIPSVTWPLEPAYGCLLARYGDLIGEGRQLTLPWEPHGARLQRDWLAVAIDFVNGPRRAPVQRLVLQASVSLAGPVDRQTAVDLLLAMAAEYPLGTDG